MPFDSRPSDGRLNGYRIAASSASSSFLAQKPIACFKFSERTKITVFLGRWIFSSCIELNIQSVQHSTNWTFNQLGSQHPNSSAHSSHRRRRSTWNFPATGQNLSNSKLKTWDGHTLNKLPRLASFSNWTSVRLVQLCSAMFRSPSSARQVQLTRFRSPCSAIRMFV